jgi:MFS family permease
MLGADLVRCVLVAFLAAFAARNIASLAALGPVAALLGAGEGLFLPASFAIMPGLLEPAQLQAGNALNSAAVQLGSFLGPVLGGVLVASAGSGLCGRRGVVRGLGADPDRSCPGRGRCPARFTPLTPRRRAPPKLTPRLVLALGLLPPTRNRARRPACGCRAMRDCSRC